MSNPYAAPGANIDALTQETYEPSFFAMSGRIGRIRYLAFLFGGYILFGLLAIMLGAALTASGMNSGVMILIMGLLYLGLIVMAFVMARRRLNDLDQSGWLSLLFLVPAVNFFFGLYLIFAPGTSGNNRYGPPTSPNTTILIIGACILPFIFVAGILAAVAVPAYKTYQDKARAAQQGQPAPQAESQAEPQALPAPQAEPAAPQSSN